MSRSTPKADRGDQFLNQEIDERCTIIGFDNMGGFRVALLQYEDGVPWDEALADGTLPTPTFQKIPNTRGDSDGGPTLRGACAEDEHVFDAEPSKRPGDGLICENCGLSDSAIGNFLGHATWDRVPAVCWLCETELAADDDRQFHEDAYICMDCCEDEWNVYLEAAYDDMDEYILRCDASPIAFQGSDCGFMARATPDTTRRFLRAPYDYGPATEADRECEGCPECGENVIAQRLSTGMSTSILQDVLDDVAGDAELTPDAIFGEGNTTRVLTESKTEAYCIEEEQRRAEKDY